MNDFVKTLASNAPAPGGGSASALAGAVGAALTSMVANLTLNKETYRDKEPLVREILGESDRLTRELLALIDLDTEAFNQVSSVFSMPKGTDDEKAQRRKAMEEALKHATEVPFAVMEKGAAALEIVEKAVNNTNPSALSDLGVAVHCSMAAVQGGWLNVLINLGGIKDAAFADRYRQNGQALVAKSRALADRLQQEIEASFR